MRGWQHEFAAKFEAGLADLTSEKLEGAALLERRRQARAAAPTRNVLRELAEQMRAGDERGGQSRSRTPANSKS